MTCRFCKHEADADALKNPPNMDDEPAWATIAAQHEPTCPWLTSRAFHRGGPRPHQQAGGPPPAHWPA